MLAMTMNGARSKGKHNQKEHVDVQSFGWNERMLAMTMNGARIKRQHNQNGHDGLSLSPSSLTQSPLAAAHQIPR